MINLRQNINSAAKRKYHGFIPARGGSKGIPLKNIKLIAGRPLIYWALDAAVGCGRLEHVYVSTDSDRIRTVVEEYGSKKVTVINRSPCTATDEASTESAMIEFALRFNVEKIVLIQATSPLIKNSDISKGIYLIEKNNADSLVSVVSQKRFRWKLAESMDAEPANYFPAARPLRQSFAGEYFENGAFYISDREMLLRSKSRLHGKIVGLPMSARTYIELDELDDWSMVERLLMNERV